MPLPVIRLGDSTSHGGKVISASPTHTLHGIGIARVGDLVSCPRKGTAPIRSSRGAPTWLIGDRMVALQGHRAACGCSLISSLATASYG
jgi:uncharacterized Zn-binding protein involved in type VI secretion